MRISGRKQRNRKTVKKSRGVKLRLLVGMKGGVGAFPERRRNQKIWALGRNSQRTCAQHTAGDYTCSKSRSFKPVLKKTRKKKNWNSWHLKRFDFHRCFCYLSLKGQSSSMKNKLEPTHACLCLPERLGKKENAVREVDTKKCNFSSWGNKRTLDLFLVGCCW